MDEGGKGYISLPFHAQPNSICHMIHDDDIKVTLLGYLLHRCSITSHTHAE
jgi:hypothetical protein